MKTNTKEVKQAIRKFIADSIDLSGYDMANNATNLLTVFRAEYGHQIKSIGEQRAFMDWLAGVPSAIDIPIYNDEVLAQMENFGLPNDKDYSALDTWDLFRHLLYRETVYLANQESKEFVKQTLSNI